MQRNLFVGCERTARNCCSVFAVPAALTLLIAIGFTSTALADPGQVSSFSVSGDNLFNLCSGQTDSYSLTDHEVAHESTSADGTVHLDLQSHDEFKVDDPTYGEGTGHGYLHVVMSTPSTQSTTETDNLTQRLQFPGPDNNEKLIVQMTTTLNPDGSYSRTVSGLTFSCQ
jgi:hypothetical protein